MSTQEVISMIQKQTGETSEKVAEMVEEKFDEFSGMITKEAAAHLIARELGAKLPDSENSKLQIKNLVPDMRNVSFIGKIFKISPVNEFQKKNGDKGKVVNLFISDGTGYTRIPLWNDQVKIVVEEIVKIGDIVEIVNGFSKENVYGEVEIAIGKQGGIKKLEEASGMPDLDSIQKEYFSDSVREVKIENLIPGKFQVKGTIVQVFRGNFIFESEGGGKGLVASCLIEDDTGVIRTVFFRKMVEDVSGSSLEDFEKLDAEGRFVLAKEKMLGKDISVTGMVKSNKFFKTIEMIADSVKDLNPLDESKGIADELETRLDSRFE